MTSVPLKTATIKSYLGQTRYNSCQPISRIHLQYEAGSNVANVEARIPASTTRQGSYHVSVRVRNEGGVTPAILGSSCSCPIGYKCKHIYKVMCRIATSPQHPIAGPDPARVARRQRLAAQMDHASVYIAFTCKSELDSGSDYGRSYYTKDNFDQEVLGVFFSKSEANRRAKDYVRDELQVEDSDDEEDDEEEEEDYDDDDDETYVWDGSNYGLDCGDDDPNAFHKVWVEQRAIEDASPRFRR